MTLDPRSVEAADVYRNDEPVGALRRTSKGSVFEYRDDFFAAHKDLPGGIAVHLPYARKSTETQGVNLPTYFAGLLPEGLRLRTLVARTKTSQDDLFSLLIAAGSDCVGDLFVVAPGADPRPLEKDLGERQKLAEVSFRELFDRSLGSAAEPAVPGVQDKLSPSVISFPFAVGGRRSILKLNPPDKPLLIQNEHFFMKMAKACKLDVALTRIVVDRDGDCGLLVERFDRHREKGRWRGIHQEDACQLLDKYPSEKYRLTISELAEALLVCASPLAERMRLLELVAFSYLIGNGDLHAKNVSIGARGDTLQLTPAYDLLSTRPYGDRHLALQIDGRDDNLKRAGVVDFGRRQSIPLRALEAMLDRLTTLARPFLAKVSQIGLPAAQTKTLVELMKKRLADLER